MPGSPQKTIRTYYHQRQAPLLFNTGASIIHTRSIYFAGALCSLTLSSSLSGFVACTCAECVCWHVGEVGVCLRGFMSLPFRRASLILKQPGKARPVQTYQEINATRVLLLLLSHPQTQSCPLLPFYLPLSLFSPLHPSVLLGALIKNGVSVCCIFKWSWMDLNG